MNVLIVEDSDLAEVFRRYIEAMFIKKVDVRVKVCRSIDGVAAAIAKVRPPQVILLDLNVPPVTPEMMIAEFIPAFAKLGDIVVCSDNEDEDIIRRCILAGANDFLPKKILFGGHAENTSVAERLRVRIEVAYYRHGRLKGFNSGGVVMAEKPDLIPV